MVSRLLLVFLVSCGMASAQNGDLASVSTSASKSFSFYMVNPEFDYKNILKASATLAPGFMLNQTQTNIYVHGHLEYFPESYVSLRGDGYWFTGAQQKPSLLKQNSTLLFGALMHTHKDRLDAFIGLQAGVAMTQPTETFYTYVIVNGSTYTDSLATAAYKLKAIPVIAPVTGVTFYPGKYVNFFLELRYLSGRYFGYRGGQTLYMNELRLSAGLGFQVPLRKRRIVRTNF